MTVVICYQPWLITRRRGIERHEGWMYQAGTGGTYSLQC